MADVQTTSAETLIAVFHEHWIKYVRLVFVYVLLLLTSFLIFYFAALSAYHYDWLAEPLLLLAIALVLFDHHWFFMATLSQAENHLIITSERLIWVRNRLFFDEEMHEYAFDKMKTVGAEKNSLLQYILQFGTLRFESGLPIPFVAHPNSVVKKIEQAMGMV